MLPFIQALIPIIVLIAIGYVLKRVTFLSDDIWAGIEKLTYYVMFPALLIYTLARQDIHGTPWPLMLFVTGVSLLGAAAVLIAWFHWRHSTSATTFTSIFQGGVRFNTYIALSVSGAFYGEQGLALASRSAGFMIVVINLLCVSVFALYGDKQRPSAKTYLKQIAFNPLIVGCAIGWFLSLTGIGLPGISVDVFEIIGRATLPIGLLAVGAALKPRLIPGHLKSITVASVVQFLIKPALVFWLASLIGLPPLAFGVILIAFISPTASSAYILARQLGGDLETMASIITLQTILAFAFMPLWAVFLA